MKAHDRGGSSTALAGNSIGGGTGNVSTSTGAAGSGAAGHPHTEHHNATPPNRAGKVSAQQQASASQMQQQHAQSRLAFFDHLPRRQLPKNPDLIEPLEQHQLHPATVKLGGLYSKGMVQTDDDRVTALVAAFCRVTSDYHAPPKKVFREDFDRYISKQVQFLVDSRQISKGMGNLIKYFRYSISRVLPDTSEADAKALLRGKLLTFLEERVLFAADSIARSVQSIIVDNDVILTFGFSPLVTRILFEVAESRRFRVVVIDARPLNEGLRTLTALSHQGIQCVYSPLSGAAAAMQHQGVTSVLLGASSLLSNGALLAPAGTAMVASLARSRQIPVIVAAESYKFSERVQLDSIVYNELGHGSEIAALTNNNSSNNSSNNSNSSSASANSDCATAVPQLQSVYQGAAGKPGTSSTSALQSDAQELSLPFSVINLRYDVTPINNISVVATEAGLIPPTSIPVLMREILSDLTVGSITTGTASAVHAAANVAATAALSSTFVGASSPTCGL